MGVGVSSVVAVLRRPMLWPTALRQLVRLAPNGWWRRAPFLPLPDERWLRFRVETQYGDAVHEPLPDDVVAYLQWCRAYQRNMHRRRSRV
jgi:hypothetical protein